MATASCSPCDHDDDNNNNSNNSNNSNGGSVNRASRSATKELLAEVVMVEEEIARLEREISKIQQDSSRMQDVKEDDLPKFNPYMTKKDLNASMEEPLARTNEKLALETGPMFFINQAIKRDYILRGFTGKGKNETSAETVNRRETHGKTGVKQSSPKPPRNASPRSDANTEMLLKLLREPSSNISNPPERNGQNWQPNKLSEKLMKCVVCIFLRLIRTSRTSELERSGNLSRSPTSSLRSRSIHLQSGLNLKTSVNFQKEMGQQDPYGVFQIEDSLTRDIGPYKNLIRCTSTSLDLKNISTSLQLLGKLRDLMNNLHKVDLRFLSHHQKLAFWINVYNTCIMHGFLEHGLPTSHEKIVALKNKAVLNVGGNKLNALTIEHFILKQPSRRKEAYNDLDERENVVSNIY